MPGKCGVYAAQKMFTLVIFLWLALGKPWFAVYGQSLT